MSNIKTWKKRITAPLTNQRNLFMSMQAEINELRAALAERGAKLAALEKQEPMAWLVYANGSHRYSTLTFDVSKVPDIYVGGDVVALYAAAGAAPVPNAELAEALEDLMSWQVKNVKRWHNSAYDNAARVLKKLEAGAAPAAKVPEEQTP